MSARLLTELLSNGQIDGGEGVTMALCLYNWAYPSDPLLGTLTPTSDVVPVSPPQWYGSLAQAETACRPFQFQVTGTCGVPVDVTLSLDVPGVGPARQVRFRVPVGPVAMNEDFDDVTPYGGLPSGWTTDFVDRGGWVTGNSPEDTLPYSAHASAPPIRTDSRLVSRPFALPSASSILSFRHSYLTESYYDGAVIEISVGGGPFEDVITAGGEFIAGPYTHVLQSRYGGPLAGRWAWSGSSSGFVTTLVRLPPAASNQMVRLRWRVATDDAGYGGIGSGWSVDTIHVTSETCGGVPPDVPWGLQAVVHNNQLNLTWNPPLGGTPTGYLLEGSLDGGASYPLTLATGPSPAATLSGPDIVVNIRVRALTAAGPSAPSNAALVELGAFAPPGAPRNLLASVDGSDVVLAWELAASGGPTTGLMLEVGSGAGLADLAVVPLGPGSSTLRVPSAPPGSFHLRLRPIGPWMNGTPSNEVAVTVPAICEVPAAPVFITAAQSATTGLSTVRWQLAAIGTAAPLGWYVQAGSGPGLANVGVLATAERTLTVAAPPRVYYLRVLALNSCGVSAPSPSVVLTVR